MVTVGQKIQAIRLEKGITQAGLVRDTGIPQSALSDIERGKRDFTVSTLIRLCSALDVSPGKVFEAGPPIPDGQWITRERIERLARAVWGSREDLNLKEKQTTLLLRDVVPMGGRQKSQKKIYRAWNALRKRFTNGEIRILTERVLGEGRRRHA